MQTRILSGAIVIAAVGLVAACAQLSPTPAAQEATASEAKQKPDIPKQAPVAKHETRQIVVQRGQSLSRIAAETGISQHEIATANNLATPYKINIGQHLLIPSGSNSPPAPAAAETPPPRTGPSDRPAVAKSVSSAMITAAATPAAPVAPASKPVNVAESPGDNSSKALQVPVPSASMMADKPMAPSDSAGASAPASTAAASSAVTVPAAPPLGVVCPTGTTGMWSTHDITKMPVYICHQAQSQS